MGCKRLGLGADIQAGAAMSGRPLSAIGIVARAAGVATKLVHRHGGLRLLSLDTDAARVLLTPCRERPETVSSRRGYLDKRWTTKGCALTRFTLAQEMSLIAERITGEPCRVNGFEVQRRVTGGEWVRV